MSPVHWAKSPDDAHKIPQLSVLHTASAGHRVPQPTAAQSSTFTLAQTSYCQLSPASRQSHHQPSEQASGCPQDRARAVPALGLEMALVECKLGKAPASGLVFWRSWYRSAQLVKQYSQASLSRPIPRVHPGKGSSCTLLHTIPLPFPGTVEYPGAFSCDSLFSSVHHQISPCHSDSCRSSSLCVPFQLSATMSLGHQPCTAGPQQPPPSWCLNQRLHLSTTSPQSCPV